MTTIGIDGRMMYRPQCAGIARVVAEQLRHWPANSGRVVLLVPRGGAAHRAIDGLQGIVELREISASVTRPFDVAELNACIRSSGMDVLYSPYHALAPLWARCPVVVGVHDIIIESDRRLAGGVVARAAYRLNSERAIRSAAAVVTPSRATADMLPAVYGRIPPTRVCEAGVEAARWLATDGEVQRARVELSLPERFVLHVGARRQHKNQSVLVRAMALVDDDIGLVLVGRRDPRSRDDTARVAAELGVAGRVTQLEGVPDELLRGVYGAAKLFAFPSYAEGFGIPVLEAMAAGTPVVASAIPAVAEVCRGAALYASPFSADDWAAAMGAVLDDPGTAAELVRRGRLVAARSGWGPGAAKLADLLCSVAGAAPARRRGRERSAA